MTMKTKRLILLSLIFALCIPFSCEKEDPVVKVTAVSVSENRVTITEGDLNKLHITINPEKATNKKVTWKSSNASIVFVDQNGEMVANKAGSATITVTTEEGNKTATCDVTVEPKTVPVAAILLNIESAELVEGDSELLTFIVEPTNATNKNVQWKSSDDTIVFVDENGKITAMKAGNATITAISELGNSTATCTVFVEPKTIAVTGITLNKKLLTLVEGDGEKLTASIEPSNSTNKNIVWKSSHNEIATVDYNGKVSAHKTGIAKITVTSEDGNHSATCDLTVEEKEIPVNSVSLSKIELCLVEGDSEILTATITPSDATYKDIDWVSGDESIVIVDSHGKVTALTAGVALITVTAQKNGEKDVCAVVVEPKIVPVTGVTLNITSLTITKGESEFLTAEVVPSDATNKELAWKSSNAEIASVDVKGKITAHEPGSAMITVTTVDGGKTAKCEVTVEVIPVTGVTLNKSSLTIDVNESETLISIIEPTNATNKNVTWKSGNNNIATVDSKGKVFGVNVGSTTITVTTEDGAKTAICDVAVTKSWLSLSQDSFHTSGAGESFYIDVDASEGWSVSSKPHWITITPLGSTGGNMGVSSVEVSVSDYDGSAVYRSGEVIFKLNGRERTTTLTVDQYNFPYVDGDYVKVQSSTRGNGIDLVFLGDGYTIDDIGRGKFRDNLNEAVEHFFDIEPYRSYREYFDVYIVYAFSEESGISDHINTKNTKFSSKYENPNTTRMTTDNTKCFEYALKVPLSSDLSETLITVITNSSRYAGTNWSYSNGMAISIVPVSDYPYPYDFRSILQHEAAGHGFGKLADEYINSYATITTADKDELKLWQQWGFYLNVDLTNDLNSILWKHFIGDPNYSYVGAHEGGYYYAYGVWRPEVTSLMINNITYINAPSRELIVRRIKRLAGEVFSFNEFKQKDVRETHALTRSASVSFDPKMLLPPPILIEVK